MLQPQHHLLAKPYRASFICLVYRITRKRVYILFEYYLIIFYIFL